MRWMQWALVGLGVSAFGLATVPAPGAGKAGMRSAMVSASSQELAGVRGMAFQHSAGDPILYPGQCCDAGGGTRCTPETGGVGSSRDTCHQTLYNACNDGAPCYVPVLFGGPWKDDACTTAGAQPGNQCVMKKDGKCAEIRYGHCTGNYTEPFLICYCETSGLPTSVQGRKYCDHASISSSTDCP